MVLAANDHGVGSRGVRQPVVLGRDQLRRTAHDFRHSAPEHPHVVPLLVARPLPTPATAPAEAVHAPACTGFGLTPVVAIDMEKGDEGGFEEMRSVAQTFAPFRPFRTQHTANWKVPLQAFRVATSGLRSHPGVGRYERTALESMPCWLDGEVRAAPAHTQVRVGVGLLTAGSPGPVPGRRTPPGCPRPAHRGPGAGRGLLPAAPRPGRSRRSAGARARRRSR